MSIDLYEKIIGKEPVEQFVIFYNYRMDDLMKTNLPIIRFEDLILNTKNELERVCSFLNINFKRF